MIVNLHKDLKNTNPDMRYMDVIRCLCEKTGIGTSIIQRTLSQYKATGTVTSPCKKKVRLSTLEKMTMDQKALLRLKVHQFWERKELPTIKSLLAVVNADGSFPKFSHTTLYRILKSLNFRYTGRVKNCAVLEQPYILNWREKYIQTIRQYREEGRPIYYLDETWVNTGDCRKKIWRDVNVVSVQDARRQGLSTGAPAPTGRGKRLIVLHIGSADGFLPGGLLCFESKTNTADYHDEMNGDTFFEWFCRIEPLLKENAVVVMDNAPYHSRKLEMRPTSTWRKQQLKEWLISKGHHVPDTCTRSTLLQMARSVQSEQKYVVDEYAREHNKTILRLSPYHCELNPIELAWASVKNHVKSRNTEYNMPQVKQLLVEGIEGVTSEMWKNLIRHTGIEQKLMDMDRFSQDTLEMPTIGSDVDMSDTDVSD
ncbi:uncharacterized protein LOC114882555 [Osmia bicornis bicornis]|uniref:uncharacterized protein LOC114882555 n=1 Tax=Osmia bicornis bicornis TaxID=1437191 RepID=UPI001EAED7BF|nr:uncharacterized protein LOC114882555 [Osmia bicornis bicornis]